MATVLQLSFLGSMHETTRLASVVVGCMNKRFDLGVEGATPDPDYDGILATLQACLSQTSHFSWDMLRELVESKFKKSRSWLELRRSPLKRLSPNTLLAAMDYLLQLGNVLTSQHLDSRDDGRFCYASAQVSIPSSGETLLAS
jgi:hypothetical protein